jgi:hypothetical protein
MRAEQEQAIRERAYAIWEQEGHPEGKALDHWLLAEAFNATEPEPPTPSPAPRGIPLWDRALRCGDKQTIKGEQPTRRRC